MAAMNERRLCKRLKAEMVRIKRASYSAANIRIEREVTVDPEPDELLVGADGDEDEGEMDYELPEGRIDLCFYLPSNLGEEQAYFGIEAKLVREADNKLNGSYVSDGVARFRRGLYAPRMCHGMMLGFVMRGDGGKIAAFLGHYMNRKWGTGTSIGVEVHWKEGTMAFRGRLPRERPYPDMEILHVFTDMSAHESKPL